MNEKLKEIVNSLNIRGRMDEFSEKDDLFTVGILDSLILIQLIMNLENTFKISIENANITYDNFKSIENMSKYLREHHNQSLT